VADVGFFKIDISRPHTVVLNPIVGGRALAAGIVLILVGLRSSSPDETAEFAQVFRGGCKPQVTFLTIIPAYATPAGILLELGGKRWLSLCLNQRHRQS
jgi:hypothetical protein